VIRLFSLSSARRAIFLKMWTIRPTGSYARSTRKRAG
jgi:hypothetical protein